MRLFGSLGNKMLLTKWSWHLKETIENNVLIHFSWFVYHNGKSYFSFCIWNTRLVNILNMSNCWYIPSLIEANRSFNLWSTLGPKAKLLTNTTLQWLKQINKQWRCHLISVQNRHYFKNSYRSSRCCKNVEV